MVIYNHPLIFYPEFIVNIYQLQVVANSYIVYFSYYLNYVLTT